MTDSTSPTRPSSRGLSHPAGDLPVHVAVAVDWTDDERGVRILDQTLLPDREELRELRTLDDVCEAISSLRVRGAPAIGIAGAMGLVASVVTHLDQPADRFRYMVASAADRIAGTRPTAVNLSWALRRMVRRAEDVRAPSAAIVDALRAEATAIRDEDREMCQRIGENALPLIADGTRVLTHCNAGALATGGIGTALAPIYLAHAAGRRVEVFADETRPLLQGSRLTAWELRRAGIPVTILTDGMAAALMAMGEVDLCLVGADRIAANGDVANKIGTYSVALAARHHGIPFHVLAPTSTLDPDTPSGSAIPIEQRAAGEVASFAGTNMAPPGVRVFNPAFDVTPAALVTSIVTDRGVFTPPYLFSGH